MTIIPKLQFSKKGINISIYIKEKKLETIVFYTGVQNFKNFNEVCKSYSPWQHFYNRKLLLCNVNISHKYGQRMANFWYLVWF